MDVPAIQSVEQQVEQQVKQPAEQCFVTISKRINPKHLPVEVMAYIKICKTPCKLTNTKGNYFIQTTSLLDPFPPHSLIPHHILKLYKTIFNTTNFTNPSPIVPENTLHQHLTSLKRYGLIASSVSSKRKSLSQQKRKDHIERTVEEQEENRKKRQKEYKKERAKAPEVAQVSKAPPCNCSNHSNSFPTALSISVPGLF